MVKLAKDYDRVAGDFCQGRVYRTSWTNLSVNLSIRISEPVTGLSFVGRQKNDILSFSVGQVALFH